MGDGSGIPYQVAIFMNGFYCGGTIISPLLILTAAHCLVKVRDDAVTAYAGTRHPSRFGGSFSTQQIRKSRKLHVHEKYRRADFRNDIALIELSSPFQFTESVASMRLPMGKEDFHGNAIVSGWGATKENGTRSRELRFAIIPILPDSVCKEGYGNEFIPDCTFCAGKAGIDSCQGDSGGPVVCHRRADKSEVLCGVVSWGHGCGRKGLPGINTKVSRYINWIRSKVPSSEMNHVFGYRGIEYRAFVGDKFYGRAGDTNDENSLAATYDYEDYYNAERGYHEGSFKAFTDYNDVGSINTDNYKGEIDGILRADDDANPWHYMDDENSGHEHARENDEFARYSNNYDDIEQSQNFAVGNSDYNGETENDDSFDRGFDETNSY